jgi:hypothetical protein
MAPELPAAAPVELGHKDEEPVRGRMDVRRQDHDLLLDLLQCVGILERIGTRSGSIGNFDCLADTERKGNVGGESDHRG